MRGPTANGSSARTRGLAGRLALGLACLFLLLAATATSASAANTYSVSVCTQTANDGITTGNDAGGSVGLEALDLCGEATGIGKIAHSTMQPTGISGGTFWTLTAPQGTVIQELDLSREIGPRDNWNTGFEWSLTTGNGNVLADLLGPPLPADGPAHFKVEASSVTADLRCRLLGTTCSLAPGPGEAVRVDVSEMVATIRDEIPPTVAFSPTPPPAVRGTIEIPYSARDVGSGVARAHFLFDGSLRSSVSDTNGGRCVAAAGRYRFLTPCRTSIVGSFPLDTTQLKEGSTHTVQVLVADASGQFGETATIPIRVHNAPTSTQRPAIAGEATPGATLSAGEGKWEGAPTGFAFQWLRCPAGVALGAEAGCAAIPGATGAQYVPTAQDIGQREVVRVTATNGFGSESALSAPSAVVAKPDTTAPVLGRVSLRGRLGAHGGHATLRFSSSEAANLSVAISRATRAGRPVVRLSRSISAGAGHLRIGGRGLRPGRYRLSLVARDDAGNASRPVRLSFRVLAG